jgi:hypothetical protein
MILEYFDEPIPEYLEDVVDLQEKGNSQEAG